MAGSQHHKHADSGQTHDAMESSAGLDHSGNLQEIEESPEDRQKKSRRVIATLVGVSAIILTLASVAIFFAFQVFDETEAPEGVTVEGEAPEIVGGETTLVENYDLTDGIIVARQTDYIFYNANLDADNQVVDPAVGAQILTEEEEELIFPNEDGSVYNPLYGAQIPGLDLGSDTEEDADPGPRPLGTNYANLLGIDVLDAQALAREHGYVVHQVFVVCPNVVRNNAPAPRPGEVLDVQTYTMRTDGQDYMFLHVMTTEPVGNAQAVPNLEGVQWRTGAQRLRDAGLGPRYEYERNSPGTRGTVLFQAPGPGSFTPTNSTVIMVLAD